MTNAANPEQVRERARKERDARKRDESDMRDVMGTIQGRRVVWKMLDRAGIFRTSFTGNSTTFFNEGQRNIGLMLLNDVQDACPEKFLVMLNENRRKPDEEEADV